MKKNCLLLFLIINTLSVNAQIKLDNTQTVEFYVKNVLLGQGIEVANIQHVGLNGGFGQFEADSIILGVKSGLILSTGNIDSINGPNNSSGYTSWCEPTKSRKLKKALRIGDKDLNKIAKRRTRDIQVIEFDFVPIKNKLEFNYVFASEEYTEFAGSKFNDVFAFFLSGPNIDKKINLALLPDRVTPISINTVNHINNKDYFRRNGGFFKRNGHKVSTWYTKNFVKKKDKIDKHNSKLMRQLQFDGLTTVLKVEYDIIPYHKYHIKIAIGDGSDFAYDSAVLLQAGSFVSVIDTKGEYYDTLKVIESQKIDIDSILEIKTSNIDTASEPIVEEDFEVTDIYFTTNSSLIPDSSKVQLEQIALYLNENKSLTCSLWGFTDNIGSKKHNQKLSEERAYQVKEYLAQKGVSEERINYQGNSFENPNFDNQTDEGRAKNRRVEIIIE